MRLAPMLLLPLALVFAACGGSTSGSDPNAGGSGGNGGTGASGGSGAKGGGGGEPCGDATCTEGTYCCNASCSQCVADGDGCTAIACGTGGSGGGGGQAGAGAQGGGGNGGAGGATFQCGAETCREGQQCCGAECGGGFCADGELPCPPVDCEPELCGQVYCDAGTLCCNSSCGTCTRPGEGCTDELCEPDCAPMQARGQGDCDGFFGWAWSGTYCTAIGGCECVGPDCGSLYFSVEDCGKAHESCPVPL